MTSQDNDEKLRKMYSKSINTNRLYIEAEFLRCPECGQEIPFSSTLRQMNEVIENHVQLHKQELEPNLLLKHYKPINIRLALTQQVMKNFKVS